MTTKREREIKVQAWFDPEDEADRQTLAAWKLISEKGAENGWKPKQIIAEAIERLAADTGFARTPPTSEGKFAGLITKMQTLWSKIEDRLGMPADAKWTMQHVTDAVTVSRELDELAASFSTNYVEKTFDDDDEE